MSSKKTKGKQMINIKKIEKDEDRWVAFSKRRNGIYNKLSELSVRYGADVAFLIHSGLGKSYTFGNPSFETVAKRFLNGETSSSSSSTQRSIMDSNQELVVEELCKLYNSLVEQANTEEEKVAVNVKTLPVEEDAWWKVDPIMVKDEEKLKQLLKKHEELYEKLCVEAAKKCNEGGVAN